MPCVQDAAQGCLQVRAPGGGQRPRVELILHRSPRNKEKVMAAMQPGAQGTHGDSRKFSGPVSTIDGYEGDGYGQEGTYDTANWAFSPSRIQIPENLLGIDIL